MNEEMQKMLMFQGDLKIYLIQLGLTQEKAHKEAGEILARFLESDMAKNEYYTIAKKINML